MGEPQDPVRDPLLKDRVALTRLLKPDGMSCVPQPHIRVEGEYQLTSNPLTMCHGIVSPPIICTIITNTFLI